MDTFEVFEQQLQNALTHLYDPAYQPHALLWAVMNSNPKEGFEPIQTAIVETIEDLEPAADVPANARVTRIYELLFYRYIKKLTQDETARRLGITTRYLRREQQRAVQVLAHHFWEQNPVEEWSIPDLFQTGEISSPEATEATAWRSQVRQELASLQQSAPGISSDVGAVIQGIIKLGPALTSGQNISLNVEPVSPNLTVTTHPTVLRQVLITAIEKLIQDVSSGQITLRVERQSGRTQIIISGYPARAESPPNSDFIQETLAAQGGSAKTYIEEERIFFLIELPSADEVTVLVVDDNADLVHFYRRYTAGTRYKIIHVAEGEGVLAAIDDTAPDIVVLDVMLPDVDGWELLIRLREHPITKGVPIIICTVVRREDLALTLGATLFVPKPIRRRQFVQALDQALEQSPIKASKT